MQRIRAIDGLRGVAVALVVTGHASEAYAPTWTGSVRAVVGNSSLGVRLFFVLSGYLITSLLLREQAKYGGISLTQFYARRCLRIFPAFYVFLAAVGIAAAFHWIAVSREQFVAAATFTWNYSALWHRGGPADGAWFLGHLWTLSLEEQFYLAWPSTIVLLGWTRARWLTLAIPLAMPLIRVAIYFAFPDQRGHLGMMFHTAIDSILVGCAFAVWQSRMPRRLAESQAILLIAIAFVTIASPIIAENVQGYRVTIGFGLDAVAAGIMILHTQRGGVFAQALSAPGLPQLGLISYSLYLWQQLFLTTRNTSWSGSLPVSIACAFGVAVTSYFLIELPFLRLKNRLAAHERVAVQPSFG